MELLFVIAIVVAAVYALSRSGEKPSRPPASSRSSHPCAAAPPPPKRPPPQPRDTLATPAGQRHELTLKAARARSLAERARCGGPCTLTGRAWVVDGDTIVIDKHHIRLAGIDAPELDQPYGKISKWAMVKICKGRTITARIRPELSHDRVVATCHLEDGTDIAALLVRQGLALDWPTYSDGRYARFEPEGVRKKLWKTALRQGRSAAA